MDAIVGTAISLIGAFFFIWGLILAFGASIILGIVCFFVPPVPFCFGLGKLLTGRDFAQELIDYFTKK
jgi:hypothetical protein